MTKAISSAFSVESIIGRVNMINGRPSSSSVWNAFAGALDDRSTRMAKSQLAERAWRRHSFSADAATARLTCSNSRAFSRRAGDEGCHSAAGIAITDEEPQAANSKTSKDSIKIVFNQQAVNNKKSDFYPPAVNPSKDSFKVVFDRL